MQSLKINVFPLQCKELAASQSGGCIQKNHHTEAVVELCKQSPQFFRLQELWDCLTLGTLADEEDGVLALLQPLIPNGVIEEDAHYVADLRFGRWSQRSAVYPNELTKPTFYSCCANGANVQTSPCRPDPPREKVFVHGSGGV